MPFFKPNPSLSLFYTTHGLSTSPPLLLIHGWCCDSHDWSWQIPFLTPIYHVIAFDLRGHGRSSAPTDLSYTVRDLASDAAALLRHLRIETGVVVMGHSLGGVTASVLSVLEKQMIRGLIVIDPPYWNPGPVCDAFLEMFAEPANATDRAIQMYRGLHGESAPEWMKMWYWRRVEGTPPHVIRQCMMGAYEEGMLCRAEVHSVLVKDRISIPRLAVYRTKENAEMERGLGVREGVDEVYTMESSGHWFHQVRSDEFNSLLGRWLQKLEGRKKTLHTT